MRAWNWLNVGCIGPNMKVKCVGGLAEYVVYCISDVACLTEILQVKCFADLKTGFRSGLENVIFLWQSRISGEKKHLVLLISQKDYVHI